MRVFLLTNADKSNRERVTLSPITQGVKYVDLHDSDFFLDTDLYLPMVLSVLQQCDALFIYLPKDAEDVDRLVRLAHLLAGYAAPFDIYIVLVNEQEETPEVEYLKSLANAYTTKFEEGMWTLYNMQALLG